MTPTAQVLLALALLVVVPLICWVAMGPRGRRLLERLDGIEDQVGEVAGRLPGYRPGVLERRLRTTVLISTKAGAVAQGILVEHDDHAVVLAQATMLADGQEVKVDGQLVLMLPDVAYVQALG